MYQGKFSAGTRGASGDVYRLIEERSRAQKPRPVPKATEPVRKPPARQTPPPAPVKAAAPAGAALPKKGLGTLVYWTCLMGFVFVFYCCTYLGLTALRDWLVRYELAQPTAKSQQIYQEYFADPQWEELYEMAGMEGSRFEGKEAFCAHMEALVGDQPLTMLETSNGLRQDKKYLLRLGETAVASFTLTNLAPDAREPQWQLGKLELRPKGQLEVTITMAQGSTALVNGTALTQEHITGTGTLPVREHVPASASIPSLVTLRCGGLLALPQVVIQDAAGNQREALYDPATNTFTQEGLDQEIPEEMGNAAMEALKAYVVFMSTRGGNQNFARYFDTTSDIYRELTSTDRRWTQEGTISYSGESVTGYRSYSADLFSAWAGLDLNITRADGSVKTTRVEQTMFFSRNSRGSWVCYDMTAQNLSIFQEKVKLTFRQEDTVLSSGFFLADGSDLSCPLVSAPEGKQLTGWVTRTQDDTGNTVMKLMFTPDNQGKVTIVQGFTLESMVLEPLFE